MISMPRQLVIDGRILQIFLKIHSNRGSCEELRSFFFTRNSNLLLIDTHFPMHHLHARYVLSLPQSQSLHRSKILTWSNPHYPIHNPSMYNSVYNMQHTMCIIKFIVLCFVYHCRFILYKLCIYLSSGSSFLLKR